MLSHCANAQCSKPFLRLGQGKLFLLETQAVIEPEKLTAFSRRPRRLPRHVERYWLCDECAPVWTLVHDSREGIVLTSLPRRVVSERPIPGRLYA